MTTPKSERAEQELHDKFEYMTFWNDITDQQFDELKAFIAHQRQQAVAEFAREVQRAISKDNDAQWAIRTLLKQRGIELDQPINSIFKE